MSYTVACRIISVRAQDRNTGSEVVTVTAHYPECWAALIPHLTLRKLMFPFNLINFQTKI